MNRTESHPAAARRERIDRRSIVLSPWLPTATVPYAGSFVADAVGYMQMVYAYPPTVVHLDDSFRTANPTFTSAATSMLTRRSVSRHLRLPSRPGFLHVPLPVSPTSGWLERAETAQRVGPALSGLVGVEATDVHGHIAIISGPAALGLPSHARVFLYEHASFIVDLLGDVKVARIYRLALERAENLWCVNPALARAIGAVFPDLAHKIGTHPNAVAFERFNSRARTVAEAGNWLYVGNLKQAKGTGRLIDALRAVRQRGHQVHLTVVGGGADAGWLIDLSTGELSGALTVLPPVAPSEVPDLMDRAGLLVHLSEGETFGLTAIEAVAAGLPVMLSSTDGSEQAIRPIERLAGVILDQPATSESVADSFEALLDRWPTLDMDLARAELEMRYGMRAVADVLRQRIEERD